MNKEELILTEIVHLSAIDCFLESPLYESEILDTIKTKFSNLYKLAKDAIKKPKNLLKHEDEVHEALKAIGNKIDQLKLNTDKLLEDEESRDVFKVIKFLFVSVPMLKFFLTRFLNPFAWLVLYVLKYIATKNNISIFEAWKRLFGFTFEQARKKWTPKLMLLFGTRFLVWLLQRYIVSGIGSVLLAVLGIVISLEIIIAALKSNI